MGLYTELMLSFELNGNLPEAIVSTLQWLCGENEAQDNLDNQSEITRYFSYNLLNLSGSYHFAQGTNTLLYFDTNSGTYHLTARTVTKNMSYQLQRFLYWIAPHVIRDGFIGYLRMEEEDLPTLINIQDGKAILIDIVEKSRKTILF